MLFLKSCWSNLGTFNWIIDLLIHWKELKFCTSKFSDCIVESFLVIRSISQKWSLQFLVKFFFDELNNTYNCHLWYSVLNRSHCFDFLVTNLKLTTLTLIGRGFWMLLECGGGGWISPHLLDHPKTLWKTKKMN